MKITFANETDEDTYRGVLNALAGWTVEVTRHDQTFIRGDISPGQPDDTLDLYQVNGIDSTFVSIPLGDIDVVEIV